MVKTPLHEVLTPWFMAADRLVPPWRRCIEARRSIEVAAENARGFRRSDFARELFELRETLELFALALAVGPAGFMAAVRGEDVPTDRDKYPCETLRLKVVEGTQRWEYPVKIFFDGWKAEEASPQFHATKTEIEALASEANRPLADRPRILVELELRVEWVKSCPDVTFMAELLASMDPSQFEVDYGALVVYYAALEPSSLVLLFQHLESWRSRGADVVIEVRLPGEDQHASSFTQWKTLFGLVARRCDSPAFPPLNDTACGGTWKVTIECSEDDTEGEVMLDFLMDRSGTHYTTGRLFIASLVPLTRADVSEVTLRYPLDDASGRWEDVDEKPVRLKWLAFLLRVGTCPSWRLPYLPLLDDDVDEMMSLFTATTADELMEELFLDEWGGSDGANEDFSTADTAQLGKDIRGAVIEALQHDQRRGSTLSVSLAHLNRGVDPFCRLAACLDALLTELSIDGVSMRVSAMSTILDACPSLSKLTIPVIECFVGPDAAIHAQRSHGLRSLAVGIDCMDALVCLPLLLRNHSIALEELSIFLSPGAQPQVPTTDPGLIMDSVLLATSESLATLSIAGLPVAACALPRVWAVDQIAQLRLKTLILDRVVWQPVAFEGLMTRLANESYPLTRTLATLCIYDSTGDNLHVTAPLMAMLESNRLLKHVEITLSLVGVQLMECQFRTLVTHDIVTHRRKGPLALSQKLAVLSVASRMQVPWDYESLSHVFAFAVPAEVRTVTFATPIERETRAVRIMN